MKMEIPEEEVENVLSVYWTMLQELESVAGKDPYLKNMVEGGYKVLNRSGCTKDLNPIWKR